MWLTKTVTTYGAIYSKMFVISMNSILQLFLNVTCSNVLVLLQIGNAVPSPMGAAIGFEIRKCVYVMEERRKAQSEMQIA